MWHALLPIAGAALAVAGCNSLFGVDDLAIDGPSQGGSGGAGSVGGAGGAGLGGQSVAPVDAWSAPVEIDNAGLEQGYSIALTLDHEALVKAGSAAPDGHDLRLMYDDGSGKLQEVDRVLDQVSAFNRSDTKIWWRAQGNVLSGMNRDTYYLYYGATGIAPLSDPSRVFEFWGNFDSPKSATGSHTLLGSGSGNATISDGALNLSTSKGSLTGTADAAHFWHWSAYGDFEAIALVATTSQGSGGSNARLGGLMLRESLQAGSVSIWFGPVGAPATWGAVDRTQTDGTTAENNFSTFARNPTYCRMTRRGAFAQSEGSPDGRTWASVGATSLATSAGAVLIGLAQAAEGASSVTASVSWFRLRKLAASQEPTISLGKASQFSWIPTQ